MGHVYSLAAQPKGWSQGTGHPWEVSGFAYHHWRVRACCACICVRAPVYTPSQAIKNTVRADHSLAAEASQEATGPVEVTVDAKHRAWHRVASPALEEQKKSGSNTPFVGPQPRLLVPHFSISRGSHGGLGYLWQNQDRLAYQAPDHPVWSTAQSPWENGLAGWLKANIEALGLH